MRPVGLQTCVAFFNGSSAQHTLLEIFFSHHCNLQPCAIDLILYYSLCQLTLLSLLVPILTKLVCLVSLPGVVLDSLHTVISEIGKSYFPFADTNPSHSFERCRRGLDTFRMLEGKMNRSFYPERY